MPGPIGPNTSLLQPGDYVRHPSQPDWGLGQVQSIIGSRITVNFEHAGKLLIDGNAVELIRVDPTTL
jgi:hypothetical protein